jgi:hypothetical protein
MNVSFVKCASRRQAFNHKSVVRLLKCHHKFNEGSLPTSEDHVSAIELGPNAHRWTGSVIVMTRDARNGLAV